MLALKLLHISAVIVWCGSLLYVPFAVAGIGNGEAGDGGALTRRSLLRKLFTHLATPAALLAVASGSAVFLFYGPLDLWLMAKLVLVAFLVLCHGACGMLILRSERQLEALQEAVEASAIASPAPERCWSCWGVLTAAAALLLGIAWLVLQKPAF